MSNCGCSGFSGQCGCGCQCGCSEEPECFNIVMVREDTYQMTVQYDASYGIPYDLTGATVTMIAKADPQMLDSAAIFTLGIGTGISVPTPTAGTIYVTISSANTANMAGLLSSACYSLVVENGSFRKTLLQGRISVTPSVLN